MARDAQLAGDRVQTEYYLQFADHYFRVLSENRARFEEQNPRRHRDDEVDEDEGEEEIVETAEEVSAEDRQDRPQRQDRGERFNRDRRPRRDDYREERASRDFGDREESSVNGGGETIPFDALPPAIGRDEAEETVEDEPRKPRRRTRVARPADGDDDIAPAA